MLETQALQEWGQPPSHGATGIVSFPTPGIKARASSVLIQALE